MRDLRRFFGSLLGKDPNSMNGQRDNTARDRVPVLGADYTVGDRIQGIWEVRAICGGRGRSGMGIVYVVYDLEQHTLRAMKTFQPHLVASPQVRSGIRHEAELWMRLGKHPHIVAVDRVESMRSQLYILMEYIAPDSKGRGCLGDYLIGRPLSSDTVIRWAAEMCDGMIHAHGNGVACHRDLKPGNILITCDGHAKVADFGLARACQSEDEADIPAAQSGGSPSRMFSVRRAGRRLVGTPGYMAPEIIRGAPGDVRSDVYAFGLILYQMVSGDPFPPLTGVWAGDPWSFAEENLELQRTQKVPRLGSPIIPAIDRCLAYEPSDRFASFEEVQSYLTTIVGGRPRKAVLRTMPNANGAPSTASLSIDQAISLYRLGKLEEALASIRDVRSRQGGDASVWNTEGVILSDLGQCEEALQCFDRSIGHDSHWESSWSNKGRTLRMMRRFVDAIACYDTAIRLNPGAMPPWCSKGNCLFDLGRYPDAIECYDRAIDIDPHWWDAWAGRGKALVPLGRPGEAAWCLERALEVEPDETDVRRRYDELMARICSEAGPGVDRDSLLDRAAKHHEKGQLDQGLVCMHLIRVLSGADEVVFNNEGVFLSDLGRHREALRCFERAIEVNPSYANLWCNKGRTLRAMGRNLEALECYDRAIACAPDEATLWGNKGNCLRDLHRGDEALRCYERALALRPDDGQIRRDYDELRQTRRQR